MYRKNYMLRWPTRHDTIRCIEASLYATCNLVEYTPTRATDDVTSSAHNSADDRPITVADWPTGKPGDFPVGPCFMNFSGPRP